MRKFESNKSSNLFVYSRLWSNKLHAPLCTPNDSTLTQSPIIRKHRTDNILARGKRLYYKYISIDVEDVEWTPSVLGNIWQPCLCIPSMLCVVDVYLTRIFNMFVQSILLKVAKIFFFVFGGLGSPGTSELGGTGKCNAKFIS